MLLHNPKPINSYHLHVHRHFSRGNQGYYNHWNYLHQIILYPSNIHPQLPTNKQWFQSNFHLPIGILVWCINSFFPISTNLGKCAWESNKIIKSMALEIPEITNKVLQKKRRYRTNLTYLINKLWETLEAFSYCSYSKSFWTMVCRVIHFGWLIK